MKAHAMRAPLVTVAVALACLPTRPVLAQENGVPDLAALSKIDVHGFVSEGGFVSTANDYIGASSRGSVELFEAGVNFSTMLSNRLRMGLQLFARNEGVVHEFSTRVDWAYLDYRLDPWLGLRLGVIKMPFGLYNEYTDIDAARVPILMPQSVYPLRNRDVLLSHTGVALYGNPRLGKTGELEYQLWLGTLTIPRNALDLQGATLDSVDTHYVAGAQLFWLPPVEGLRVGTTVLSASIDFNLTLDPASVMALVMGGFVPADYDGKLVVSQQPTTLWVASAELVRGDWLFAAEYSRWLKHQQTDLPDILPAFDEDAERFYVLASYRMFSWLEGCGYYSVSHVDAADRQGQDPRFMPSFLAFQRDLAATLRFDVNDHWLWKIEAHFIDGTSEIPADLGPGTDRYWGLFLARTTLSF